ncbi:GNAT family N-acetyltransferase [Microbacterium sp. BK668]|uniref:GNAT family N-acetyltransferase n=1 Tax=Microbacterium sp. BK668 TaxID=2512118 RepID=UPI0010611270|nr:GNAT family N-acetyltransferase [Microbacterium sp. BK668]TDN92666.1 acetyltransferase (GNAT) family protein [Microbacterium sp. BK668]
MTETAAPPLTIGRIVVPATVDAPDAGPFLEMVRLGNAVCLHDAGHDDLHQEPLEALGFWQDQRDWGQTGFWAERDGRILGAVTLRYAQDETATTSDFDLLVDPEHWGEGVEEALLAAAEEEARALGRTVLQTWTLHRPGTTGPRLQPSTGWGEVPADDRQTVFQLENGFTLEQVERNRAFDLRGSFALVESMLAQALAFAGEDYRVVSWTAPPTPEEFQDGYAYAISRMSTDVPQGGMVIEEEKWDAERVRRRDARIAAQGQVVSVACVQHVPTGVIAAYNELVIAADDRSGATHQYGTLVLKEHRGHRLGTIVKCANLLRWREIAPESPRVSTFNAEENRPMLDINEAIGFTPVSYAGAWKKILA